MDEMANSTQNTTNSDSGHGESPFNNRKMYCEAESEQEIVLETSESDTDSITFPMLRPKDSEWQAEKDGCGRAEKEDCGRAEKEDCGQAEKEDCGRAEKEDCGRAEKEDCGRGEKEGCGGVEKEDCESSVLIVNCENYDSGASDMVVCVKDDCQTDKTSPVSVSRNTGKWKKQHSCLFCQKMVLKMSTHLQKVHSNEKEVAAILLLAKGSKERREAFVMLQNQGDFAYNREVLEEGTGSLIPKYRKSQRRVEDCLACPFCKGLYKRQLLTTHTKRCPRKPEDVSDSDYEPSGAGDDLPDSPTVSKATRTRKPCRKIPWTIEELDSVNRQLAGCLHLNTVPQKHEAEQARAAEPSLRKRHWKDIRNCVYNMLQKKRKIAK